MVGEIDYRGGIGGGRVVEGQCARLIQRVALLDLQGARVTLVARGTGQCEGDTGARIGLHGLDTPDPLVETLRAAMERVGLVIQRERIDFAIQGKARPGNAVDLSADGRAEVIWMLHITGQIIVAQGDVGRMALAIRRHERLQGGPIRDDPGTHSGGGSRHLTAEVSAAMAAA